MSGGKLAAPQFNEITAHASADKIVIEREKLPAHAVESVHINRNAFVRLTGKANVVRRIAVKVEPSGEVHRLERLERMKS